MDLEQLEKISNEMRRLGVKEYKNGEVHVVLGDAPVSLDETSEEDQQRARDEREKKWLEHKRDILLAASCNIGRSKVPIR